MKDKKMNRTAIEPYQLSDSKEKTLWENAIIVFDSSALLDLYFSPKSERVNIITQIFKKLEGRLWLPNHVQYEYLKNREKIIKKPIKEKYAPLRERIKRLAVDNKCSQIAKDLDGIIRETTNSNKHPHLKQDELNTFKNIVGRFTKETENFKKEIEKFQKTISDEINIIEKEIADVENNDDVLESLETYFQVGREFTFQEIIAITKEGDHRYKFKIPPGYGDYQKGEKKGTQIFGDLIIWKQILEFSKEERKPIIFITNDIKKDNDWGYLDKKATEVRISSPREELIKEIKDHSSVDFWMYNFPQFLYHANKYLKSTIKGETIHKYFQFINTKEKNNNSLKLKCSSCNRIHKYDKSDFLLDFEIICSSEREMGIENQYLAEEHIPCKCGNNIYATFEVWEYPEGVHNYDNLSVRGASILESFYFTADFYATKSDMTTCFICDGSKSGGGNMVYFDQSIDLINEFTHNNPNSNYSSVSSGDCSWCNTLHIKCPKCESINLMGEYQHNENVECEGGCGLIFNLASTYDKDYLDNSNLILVDDRIKECSSCSEKFIDEFLIGMCETCEIKYEEE